jgi:hypothetical protein
VLIPAATQLTPGSSSPVRPPQVDAEVAQEVADSFTEAQSTPNDPQVNAAYRELEKESDRAYSALTDETGGLGIRVAFTRCCAPYGSDKEMIVAVREEHLLEVTTASVERSRTHPLLGGEPGGAYDRFRAVHDIVGHVAPGLGFDRNGEFGAWAAQEWLYSWPARWALATELHAEHSVRWITGDVADHKATLLDEALLSRARRPIRARTGALKLPQGATRPGNPLDITHLHDDTSYQPGYDTARAAADYTACASRQQPLTGFPATAYPLCPHGHPLTGRHSAR